VIDVGLLPFRILARRQAETGKAGITKLSELGCGNRIASERKEAERASLEAVRYFIAAAADLDQVVAITGGFEQPELFRNGPLSGSRVAS
jgi:hypothetical protein